MDIIWLSTGAIACYSIGLIGLMAYITNKYQRRDWLLFLLWCGWWLHGLLQYNLIHACFGVCLDPMVMASFAGMLVILIILISAWLFPIESVFLVVLPINIVTLCMALFIVDCTIVYYVPVLMVIHVLLSMTAYGVLAVAACLAMLLSYREWQLRHHMATTLRLPAVQHFESMLFKYLGLGFLLLSVALISGMVFFKGSFSLALLHKMGFSLAAWGLLIALMIGRKCLGWRGYIAARWMLSSFTLLALAYFGSYYWGWA